MRLKNKAHFHWINICRKKKTNYINLKNILIKGYTKEQKLSD